jgi:hypothetical protein
MIDFNEDFIILFYATKLLTKIQLVLALNYHEVVGWIAWIPLTAPFVSPFWVLDLPERLYNAF